MQKLSFVSKLQAAAVVFFAIVYSLLSLVNHYQFRTYAFDLGIYNNAIFDYAHFRWNDCMLMEGQFSANLLSDHFEVLMIVLSPFIYVFGTYTLLVFQIGFVLFGGFGVYHFIKAVRSGEPGKENDIFPFLAQLHFYFFFGIFSALNFDYHNSVPGAMLVPWFFYFFHAKKWKWAVFFFAAVILARESMALWMGFICMGISLLYWRDRAQRLASAGFSLVAILYFLFIIKVASPALSSGGESYFHIRTHYSAVGSGLGEIITTILTQPLYVFKLLFLNLSGKSFGDYYKMETYVFVLLSGGALFFLRPQFIVMLIPILMQKMFHDDPMKWGIGDHYSIEFAPICSIGAFYAVSRFENEKLKKYFAFGLVFLSLIVLVRGFDRTYTYFDRSRHRIYQARHYQRDYNVAEAHSALASIPIEAKVSAQSPFVPHLAFRDYIYQFPVVKDAEYVVISTAEKYYPLSKESFVVQVALLQSAPGWEKIYDRNDMIIFRKKN